MEKPKTPETSPPAAKGATADVSPVRRRILDGARKIVTERGLDALSVQAVATEAGVHKSAIGYHFGNKEGLVLALIESLADDGSYEARQALGRTPDPSERFSAYLALYRELITTTDHWRLAFSLWPTPYFDEKIRVFARSASLDMVSLHMRQDDAEARVLMSVLLAAITGLAFQYAARRSEMDLDACFERLEAALAPAFLAHMEDAGTP